MDPPVMKRKWNRDYYVCCLWPSGSNARMKSVFLSLTCIGHSRTGTIAAYLKMSQVDAIYLPIPINFIFIGFEGKGNQGNVFITCYEHSQSIEHSV